MRLGEVHFDHYGDETLEDMYSAMRALARDVRRCGAYGLSNLMKKFETELVLELSVRDRNSVSALTPEQMNLLDHWVELGGASEESRST